MELVGIVRCYATSLVPFGQGRQTDFKIVDRLLRRFEKSSCSPGDEKHHIRGLITRDEIGRILAALGMSPVALQATIEKRSYPLLPEECVVAYLDGRHRVAAARAQNPSTWWAVKLLCVQGTWVEFPLALAFEQGIDNVQRLVQDEVEYAHCESPYSDGELYRLIRKYMAEKDHRRVAELQSRLTRCKETSLKGLLKNVDLVRAIDVLLEFPGLIGGLQLGNVHRHLALHIDEHIKRQLEHIHQVWSWIMGDGAIRKAHADLESVQCLQFRAPVVSKADRLTIQKMMRDRVIFRQITNLDRRDALLRRILGFSGVIPSLETFHENMKYIGLGAGILRELVMEKSETRKNQSTLFESLVKSWSRPEALTVEVGDGTFKELRGEPTADLAYTQLFIAALRHFPHLSSQSPRQDIRGETMPASVDPSRVASLLQLASSLGFDNSKIRGKSARPALSSQIPLFKPRNGPAADWRGGRPFTKTYFHLRETAFLDKVAEPPPNLGTPDPDFVFRDIVKSFLTGSTSSLARA
jgi:hypothetical protein